jgi:hypothetical protein
MTAIGPVPSRCPATLVTRIQNAPQQHADWQRTSELVTGQLRLHLPDRRS